MQSPPLSASTTFSSSPEYKIKEHHHSLPVKPESPDQRQRSKNSEIFLSHSVGDQFFTCNKQYQKEFRPKSLISNPLRKLVSKNKKRFVWENYDLDLAYITDDIIAMGFPSENIESIYRNSLDEVKGFLEARHKDHYKIYNLCAERKYDKEKFEGRVAEFPFEDHNAPPFQLIYSCCEDIRKWLAKDPENVAAVHCKAGKGRTGLIICCYLLYCGLSKTAETSLQHYAQARTLDGKGVTIQSQRRYTKYFQKAIRSNLSLTDYLSIKRKIKITSIQVTSCPHIHMFSGCTPWVLLTSHNDVYKSKYDHDLINYGAGEQFELKINHDFYLTNDFKITFFSKGQIINSSTEFMRLWFNAKFIDKEVIEIPANEIDGVKDSDARFNMKMKVIVTFKRSQ